MIASDPIPWSPPRWLHRWAVGTVALLFVLLAVGAVVTSFRVGMADPVWPTRPWHLLTVAAPESSAGYLVEHVHRLAGFTVGGAVTVLALGTWLTERRPWLRWGGAAALVVLLVAFGQLHGTLIRQQRLSAEAGTLQTPDWRLALGPTLGALAVVLVVAGLVLRFGSDGRGMRVLGVFLLLAVMVQGMLGGLRVYLNALAGADLATLHGAFSQIVVLLAIGVLIGIAPRGSSPTADRWRASWPATRWALLTAGLVYAQIVFGAVVRHTTSSLGPRLHLVLAFAVLAGVVIVGRLLADAPRPVRRLKMALHAIVGLQILLGVEAWMSKFSAGLAVAQWQPITPADAALRTAHTLTGYALFALTAGLALILLRTRAAAPVAPPATLFASPSETLRSSAVEVLL